MPNAIGGDKESAEIVKAVSVMLYVFGVAFMILGIGSAVYAKKLKNIKIVYKNGKIISKETINKADNIVVEFKNGERQKLYVEPPLIVAKGDEGVLGYKKNLLVEFNRNN